MFFVLFCCRFFVKLSLCACVFILFIKLLHCFYLFIYLFFFSLFGGFVDLLVFSLLSGNVVHAWDKLGIFITKRNWSEIIFSFDFLRVKCPGYLIVRFSHKL